MKFQDSSSNGLKVTVGTKNVTHVRTDACKHTQKAICPTNFFKVGGITKAAIQRSVTVELSINIYRQK